ncbi:hypothetical protein VNO78_16281 [Psophocarpus tetragonolobus]|uniref:CASP-like protein n=1 Tax=Psophocarpus tetragonolobus TaxID=3891 RepID=A0AAN9XKJ1_PSOTE
MDSGKGMMEKKGSEKGKSVTWATPRVSEDSISTKVEAPTSRWKKGIAITDLVLRLGAIGATIGSAVTMGSNEEQLPFFTQFFQFHAQWSQFPMFQFFVVANGFISGYAVITLPLSYVCIVRPLAVAPRLLLLTMDTVMMGLISAAASAAAAIVYVGHNGSREPNWIAFCQGFTNFCQTASLAVISSFVAAVFFLCLVSLSALALVRN